MLELAILGLLQESPMHGYELRKELATKLGAIRAAISYGTLYPTLRRLQTAGWITEAGRDSAGAAEVPPLTSRRGRVVYKITAEGKERFAELLAQAGPETYDDAGFGVHFAFFSRTDRADPAAHPRGPPPPGRGAPGGPARRARPGRRAARRLHPRTAAPRPRRLRARGPLAGGAHRQRALRPHPAAGAAPPDHPASGHRRTGRDERRRRQHAMGSVRVAIVGVGNCASSLVQGVEYYRNADPNDRVPGLMHVDVRRLPRLATCEFVAAFDVDAKKVGQDLAEAIVASENNTIKLCDVPPTGVTVQRGPTFDGLGQYYREIIEESDDEPVDVVAGAARRPGRRRRLLPAGRLGAGRQVLRPGRDRRRLRASSTRCRSSSPPTRCGRRSSPTPACRSSATTSRARSARPSCTARWPSCSRTAASSCCARTSSTSAATWTS